jgi:hypothetical protein
VYAIGLVPLHEPVAEVSVWPCSAVPLIVGSEVLDGDKAVAGGGGGGGGLAAETTTAVCAEAAAAEPLRFDAVTITRRVLPTSAVESAFVELVAPPIALQPAPVESHRSH